jgi:hypothetical protein
MATDEQVKFVLRMSPALHRKIKRRARADNTSMNRVITNILSESFSNKSQEKMLADLIRRLEKKKVI